MGLDQGGQPVAPARRECDGTAYAELVCDPDLLPCPSAKPAPAPAKTPN
jgi:hypothetical protein